MMTALMVIVAVVLSMLLHQPLIAAAVGLWQLVRFIRRWSYHRKEGLDRRDDLEKRLVDIQNKLANLPPLLKGILGIIVSFDNADRAIIRLIAEKGYSQIFLALFEDNRYPSTLGGPRDASLIECLERFFRELETEVRAFNEALLRLKKDENRLFWGRYYSTKGLKYFQLDTSDLGAIAEEGKAENVA